MDFSVFALAWLSIPIGNLGKGTERGEQERQLLRAAAAEVMGEKGSDLFALYILVEQPDTPTHLL